jgi:stearoyl-CoA desaturase (delta-9 desaturase)
MLVLGLLALVDMEWYWLIPALIYTIIVNDIFCHRICSHKMFDIDPGSITYKILTFLASADMGYGPVKLIVMSHSLHHIHSDKGPEDVMNWRYHWYSTTIVSPLPHKDIKPADYDDYCKKQWQKHQAIMTDSWTNWCYDNQYAISIGMFLLLAMVCPIVLINVIFVGRVLLSLMTGLAASIGHIKNVPLSYRNFNTNDTTSNNILLHYLFLGLFAGMLQNNHHGRPKSVQPNPKWWELDTSLPIVLMLKYSMEKK